MAVKRLNKSEHNLGVDDILKEVCVLQEMEHKHIVQFFGIVIQSDGSFMLVSIFIWQKKIIGPINSFRSWFRSLNMLILDLCTSVYYLQVPKLITRSKFSSIFSNKLLQLWVISKRNFSFIEIWLLEIFSFSIHHWSVVNLYLMILIFDQKHLFTNQFSGEIIRLRSFAFMLLRNKLL